MTNPRHTKEKLEVGSVYTCTRWNCSKNDECAGNLMIYLGESYEDDEYKANPPEHIWLTVSCIHGCNNDPNRKFCVGNVASLHHSVYDESNTEKVC